MRQAFLAISMAAILLPLTACASQGSADNTNATTAVAASDAGMAGPSSGARAAVTQARADAKAASLNALSTDHRAKVQAIVDSFNSGSSLDLKTPSKAIDAVLTPAEAQAVLAQATKMRAAMRAAYANNPNGTTGRGGGSTSRKRTPDAGRFLLTTLASPDKMNALRRPPSN